MNILKDTQSGSEVAQRIETKLSSSRLSKTHSDYWKSRLFLRSYSVENRKVEIPEWHVRISYLKRRQFFNLGTSNKSIAAIKAKDIYLLLKSSGWNGTLEKYKPQAAPKSQICTIAEYIDGVRTKSHLRPKTIHAYTLILRKVAVDIAGLEKEQAENSNSKYDYVTGGAQAWREKVDALCIDIFNPEAINRWRNQYIAKSNQDPVACKSAEQTASSYLRSLKAIFSKEITSAVSINMPFNPLEGVKINKPRVKRYFSSVNVELLALCAQRELINNKKQIYLAFCLCLYGGLRRKEADLLTWEQIDLEHGRIQIRRTKYFEPKTEDSQRNIDISHEAVAIFKSFKSISSSEFVLEGKNACPNLSYQYYRADYTWHGLISWLRSKGIKDLKAIHMLRKESGSIIASRYDIEVARRHLGHSDIRTTSSHYISNLKRCEISFGTNCSLDHSIKSA